MKCEMFLPLLVKLENQNSPSLSHNLIVIKVAQMQYEQTPFLMCPLDRFFKYYLL